MSRAVLFLDFDGVLHPYGCSLEKYFENACLMEHWLRLHPSVDVVVSSSWREAHSLEEMREFFSSDVAARFIGMTPVLRREFWEEANVQEPLPMFEREVEVAIWLRRNGAIQQPWAALDDQARLFRPFNKQLVLCRSDVGLMPRELNLLDAVLESQR